MISTRDRRIEDDPVPNEASRGATAWCAFVHGDAVRSASPMDPRRTRLLAACLADLDGSLRRIGSRLEEREGGRVDGVLRLVAETRMRTADVAGEESPLPGSGPLAATQRRAGAQRCAGLPAPRSCPPAPRHGQAETTTGPSPLTTGGGRRSGAGHWSAPRWVCARSTSPGPRDGEVGAGRGAGRDLELGQEGSRLRGPAGWSSPGSTTSTRRHQPGRGRPRCPETCVRDAS